MKVHIASGTRSLCGMRGVIKVTASRVMADCLRCRQIVKLRAERIRRVDAGFGRHVR